MNPDKLFPDVEHDFDGGLCMPRIHILDPRAYCVLLFIFILHDFVVFQQVKRCAHDILTVDEIYA